MHWRLRFAEYLLDEKYKQAKLNCVASAVSRLASTGHTVVEKRRGHTALRSTTVGNEDSDSGLDSDLDMGWQNRRSVFGFTRDPLRR